MIGGPMSKLVNHPLSLVSCCQFQQRGGHQETAAKMLTDILRKNNIIKYYYPQISRMTHSNDSDSGFSKRGSGIDEPWSETAIFKFCVFLKSESLQSQPTFRAYVPQNFPVHPHTYVPLSTSALFVFLPQSNWQRWEVTKCIFLVTFYFYSLHL